MTNAKGQRRAATALNAEYAEKALARAWPQDRIIEAAGGGRWPLRKRPIRVSGRENEPMRTILLTALAASVLSATVLAADNAGYGARGMADYTRHVRSKYNSHIEWFDINLPWAKRDAIEVTIIEPPKGKKE